MEFVPSTALETLARLAIAVVAGGLLGFEREWKRKPAGLRTHMMVCLGAATFTVIAAILYGEVLEQGAEVARIDPLRILQGLVGGLGFLGAGSIIQAGGRVSGLTTAGGLWLAGGVGVSVGAGSLVTAGGALVLGLLVLTGFQFLERRLPRNSHASRDDESRAKD
jgi:putative Mg2+ transporter-C (MgtC) family protein